MLPVQKKIPLWIMLPCLPVGYWSSEALSKVASDTGKPPLTDSFTASMARISYARVLDEADQWPLLESIEVMIPTGSFHN
uniref:Putative ovule protein n=1 Tax=Solanum chacoense TaxID=4108 RepID=A0A0V0GPR0_SOLCH